jgi:hypothetical protein
MTQGSSVSLNFAVEGIVLISKSNLCGIDLLRGNGRKLFIDLAQEMFQLDRKVALV